MPENQDYSYGLPSANMTLSIKLDQLPKCPKCENGVLLPMADETRAGNVMIKGWVCSSCYHNRMLDKGKLTTQAIMITPDE